MRRPLVIVGPPTSWASNFAKFLSEQVGSCLVKADALSLASHLDSKEPCIIDLCGEAWLERKNRVSAIDRCVVISVTNGLERDGAVPARDGSEVNGELWRAAGTAFCEAHLRLPVQSDSFEKCADRVLDLWRRDPIGVAVSERSYVVDIGRGIATGRMSRWLEGSAANLFVTDSNVDRLYGERIESALLQAGARVVKVVFAAGEEQKHLQTLTKIFTAAQAGGIDRSSRVIAVGGGVVTDVGGFAAATWMRGIPWFSASTTLLGMVDASVGGKTAVDLGEGKNAVGAFWQPSAVVCDTDWLKTESDRNYSGALAEVVKTAIIGDPELFGLLECRGNDVLRRDLDLMVEVVRRCIRVKARIVGMDETERGVRATLNLGHTIGHALEAEGGYTNLSHGEAVSLGLVAALRIGYRLGFTAKGVVDRVVRLQESLGLPVALSEERLRAAAELLGHDKKRVGSKLRFIVVEGVGKVGHRWLLVEDLRDMMVNCIR